MTEASEYILVFAALKESLSKMASSAQDMERLKWLESEMLRLRKENENLSNYKKNTENRISEILDVVTALAKLDYSAKAKVTGSGDHVDALAAGVNMMGEELEASTVSLSEKEILLKEIHHRVKNNLQLVSSLLSIQSSYVTDPVALSKFRESQNRVNSMALIHEKLYLSRNFSMINFGEYLQSIANYLSLVYNINPDRIQVENKIQAGSEKLNLDTALPCGLIINEILSNMFKYAFPGERQGKIIIEMHHRKEENINHFDLIVADNGIGLPGKFNPEESATLGMQLIVTLVDQLDGQLDIVSNPGEGTRFIISFSQ